MLDSEGTNVSSENTTKASSGRAPGLCKPDRILPVDPEGENQARESNEEKAMEEFRCS